MDEKMRLNFRFPKKVTALRKFGFPGKVLIQALWKIPGQSERYVWTANDGEYDFDNNIRGKNELSDDGLIFRDRRDSKSPNAGSYHVHENIDVERILFLVESSNQKQSFRFVGVFKPDVRHSIDNVSAWMRVATECTLPEGSWGGLDAV